MVQPRCSAVYARTVEVSKGTAAMNANLLGEYFPILVFMAIAAVIACAWWAAR